MKIYNTKHKLPEHGEWVLIFDSHSQLSMECGEDARWTVAQFIGGGLTEKKREELRKEYEETGKNKDYQEEMYWSWRDGFSKSPPRHLLFKPEDVSGNNLVPYYWDGHGSFEYFGQAIRFWAYLPTMELKEQWGECVYDCSKYSVGDLERCYED